MDYYDITTIDGVNLPLEMKPDFESFPLDRDDDCECFFPLFFFFLPLSYFCFLSASLSNTISRAGGAFVFVF